MARFLPLAAMLCAGFPRRVGPAAEEAAIVSGASWRRTFVRIVLPLAGRGLAVVWLVMFILMFGDVALMQIALSVLPLAAVLMLTRGRYAWD